MTKIMFVCFGNICRSPMAEFVMKDLISKAGLSNKIIVKSSGCHAEVDTPIYSGTREQLRAHNIPFNKNKRSIQLLKTDYKIYDYIVGMDRSNIDDMKYIFYDDPDKKVHLLLDFVGEHRDVADPWYTDDFETTYADVLKGCEALLEKIKSNIRF